MRDPIQSWRAEGVDVVIVGNGNRDFAKAFREEFELEGLLLVDPDLHAYRAAGLRRGRRELASPQLFGNAIRALRSGSRQTSIQGDPWQLGGVLVFGRGGELRFQYRSAAAGDHALPQDIEAALDETAPVIEEAAVAPSLLAPAVKALRPALDTSPFGSFDRLGFQRHAVGFDPADLDVDLYGRRFLVTGGDVGIGYEAALALADLGAEIVLLCIDTEAGKDAVESIRSATGNARVTLSPLDLTSFASIDAAAKLLSSSPIDGLIHCADVLSNKLVLTQDGCELALAIHVVGPHRLTRGLTTALEASDDARVIWVSAGALFTRPLNIEDPQWANREYDGNVAFAESKRAQVVLAELWAETFDGSSVTVNSMHPGWVDTAVVRSAMPLLRRIAKPILRNPSEGADTIVWLAASSAVDGRTGRLFFDRQAVRTHWFPRTKESSDDRDRLWQICDQL